MKCDPLRHQKIKDKIFLKLGKACVECGFSDRRALHIDHIKGGGCKDYKNQGKTKYTGGLAYYMRVLKDQTGKFQILCANCNAIKRVEEMRSRKSL